MAAAPLFEAVVVVVGTSALDWAWVGTLVAVVVEDTRVAVVGTWVAVVVDTWVAVVVVDTRAAVVIVDTWVAVVVAVGT